MTDLAAWLLDCIDEREQAAQRCLEYNDEVFGESDKPLDPASTDRQVMAKLVLAECAAKRELVELHAAPCDECLSGEWVTIDGVDTPRAHGMDPCKTLRLLVQPYADRPGFDPAWLVDSPIPRD